MRQSYQEIFDELVPLLVNAVPEAIASADVPKPICSARIYYYDTHADCTYLTLRTMSQGLRDQLVEAHGWNAPFHLWASGEEERDADIEFGLPDDDQGTAVYPRTMRLGGHDVHCFQVAADAQVMRIFEHVYGYLAGEDDSVDYMSEFQKSLQRVCGELNARDWNAYCDVADDFVIAPADGSQYFGGNEDYNDLVESIPAERIALLRKRSLLGPKRSNWFCLPGQRPTK